MNLLRWCVVIMAGDVIRHVHVVAAASDDILLLLS